MEAEVIERMNETPTMIRLTLKLPEALDFKPGQFVMLNFPDDKKLKRAYSIASEPGKDVIELIIKIQGQLTNRLEKDAQIGCRLTVNGPYGNFSFDEEVDKRNLVLLGAGCGVTPLRSILTYIMNTDKSNKVIMLLSSRNQEETPCAPEIKKINELQSDQFKIVHTYTRLTEDDAWQGDRGRITDEMIKKHVPDFIERSYYICGSPQFAESMIAALDELKVPKEQVHKEQW